MSIFDDSRAIWVLFRKWVVSENRILLRNGWPIPGYSDLVLGGEVPRLSHGPICFPIQKTWGGATGHWKSEYHFFDTFTEEYRTLIIASRYCIKNQSIGVAYGALLNLFWIFKYVTSEPFAGPLSADFTDVKKVQSRFLAICFLIFKSKTSIKV